MALVGYTQPKKGALKLGFPRAPMTEYPFVGQFASPYEYEYIHRICEKLFFFCK